MSRRRRYYTLLVLLGLIAGLGGIVGNVASSALPPTWSPYLWLAWPLFGILTVAGIVLAICQARIEPQPEPAPSEPQALPQPPSPLHQLPADLPDFTGRQAELHQLLDHLAAGPVAPTAAAISAIGGMGGIGKTALAVHVAHRLAGRFPDAQIVVDLAGTTGQPLAPEEAMRRVVHAFRPELRLPDDPAELAAVYRTTLSGRRALLLLDDAAGGAQVRPLLPPAPCGLIVTSRRSIALSGMRSLNLDLLSMDEARALLREILGAERATPEELDGIAQLCGRLPLALRVAGSFLKVHADWTPAEYAQALADERDRLARLVHEDLDVRAALRMSAVQLVRERAELAAAWQMLSVFPAPFDRAAAAAVWEVAEAEARDWLSELAVRSLLLYDAGGQVYRLHDLMRPVARDVFAHDGAGPDAEAEGERLGRAILRHAEYYLAWGDQAQALYKQGGEQMLEALRRFDAAWPHLQAAFARMQARDDDPAARWLSEFPGRTIYLLDLRLPPREQILLHEAALSVARRLRDRRAEGVHLGHLGLAYHRLGEVRRAIEYYEQALDIARQIGDRGNEGIHLGNLGLAYAALGEVRRAIEVYEQALEIDSQIGDRRGEGNALGNLGSAYADLGQVRRAIECYEQALEIARQIGDRRGEGNALGNLGNAYHRLGQMRRAIEYHEQALEIARQIGDRRAEGSLLGNLGTAYAALGAVRQTIGSFEQALEIARQIGHRQLEASTLANLGLLAREQSDAARARDLWQQALRIYEAIEDPNAERVRGWLAEIGRP
jgi:tetratricopeptide (TPR) repeat protein